MTSWLGPTLVVLVFGVAANSISAQKYLVSQDRDTGCVQTADGEKPLPTTISGGLLNNHATQLPNPAVSRNSTGARLRGKASVLVLVGEDGTVVSAAMVSGDKRLKSAVEGAALQARFRPTLFSGAPVKVSGIIQYKF